MVAKSCVRVRVVSLVHKVYGINADIRYTSLLKEKKITDIGKKSELGIEICCINHAWMTKEFGISQGNVEAFHSYRDYYDILWDLGFPCYGLHSKSFFE